MKKYGAEGGTRTPTSYLTRPSNVRVYQFRHFGSKVGKVFKNRDVRKVSAQLSRACYFFFVGAGDGVDGAAVGAAAAGVGVDCTVGAGVGVGN